MFSPLTTTFGIELEFVVAYAPEQYLEEYFPFGCSVPSRIVKILAEAGFSVNPLCAADDYRNWTVTKDGSIKPEAVNQDLPGFRFCGVEINSPVFYWSQNAAAFEQLSWALQILQQHFTMFTNKSCGLHVHVGNRDLGFPRKTLRKFAQLVTVFERQLASLHPSHRVRNVHCRAPGSNFDSHDLTKNVVTLQHIKSVTALIRQMSCNTAGAPRGFAYNMLNLVEEGSKATIEFRQHEATLDATAIAAWTTLVCGLVERCHGLGSRDLVTLVFEGIKNPAYTVIDLLSTLGLHEVAAYYGRQVLHEHPLQNGMPLYEGEAWVTEPERDTRAIPFRIVASQQPDTSNDEEIARRVALSLRPRAARSRGANSTAAAKEMQHQTEWEVQYALFDSLMEVAQDDSEDETYQ